MKHIIFPSALILVLPSIAAIPIRVGLDTQGFEWVVSLEGGGTVCTRKGTNILHLRDGEKLRIWWDSRGEADPTDEYRIQVGPPLEMKDAEALMVKLRELGERPERKHVADGNTWRVVTGHFFKVDDAEPILQKLEARGYEELWVSTEPRAGKPHKGRALYAVTERYERYALPVEGVWFKPKGETTQIVGKGKYRGKMEIYPNNHGRLTLMNTVELESYLRGVVPREMGAWTYPALDALKAQAIAARTYAYANLGKRADEGFDLVDTIADQVYGGTEGEQSLTDRAVAETEGLIATYGGQPIQALFMANGGGATIDNSFVFGGNTPYLKGVNSYSAKPQTLNFKGSLALEGDQTWLTWDLLRMACLEVIPHEWLSITHLQQVARPRALKEPVDALAERMNLPKPAQPPEGGHALFLWMARSLGLGQVVDGQERVKDAEYFLGDLPLKPSDKLLASFLVRRGIAPPALWKNAQPTFIQCLKVLGSIWNEVEMLDVSEGTLLLDGQVRPKQSGPQPLKLASSILLAEEAPGGALRLVAESDIQIGDRLKWIAQEGGSRLLVRRLDPDGTSLDRYNPMAHWKVELTELELISKLNGRVGARQLGRIELKHNENGRVLEMVMVDRQGKAHRFSGMRIRNLLGFKDNVFRYLTVGTGSKRRWIFYGRGWGHGVGMDQTGAFGMAMEGANFEQILKHYYTGIEITKIRAK